MVQNGLERIHQILVQWPNLAGASACSPPSPQERVYGAASKRREVLSEVIKPLTRKATAVSLSESIDATPAELIRVVKEFGLEGIIAKRKDSFYESGKRTGACLKYKGQQSTGVRHRRVYAGKYARCSDRRLP